ncbi:hypothetical protein BDQ17DRAFT_382489 [Cyathus striatus]|nr:hypothetical protein BDQ17DRAFT_382489 [Cyathus striatus]
MINPQKNRLSYRDIPAELLSEIFLHYREDEVNDANTIRTPLLLSSICSSWREAAIATPRLWSRIFIQLSLHRGDQQSALINTWLIRSGACPLTAFIFWETAPFNGDHPALEVLVNHSKRWKIMLLFMPFSAFQSLAGVQGNLPMLMDLSIGFEDKISSQIRGSLNMFEVTPALTSLECVNCSPFLFKFPWSQLLNIPVMAVDVDDCVGILRRSTQLQRAGFVFLHGGLPRYHSTQTSHLNLRSFTIMTPMWNETVDLSNLFAQLNVPGLEELTICNLKSHFGDNFVPFLGKLTSLKILRIRKTSLSDAELVRGLAILPSLISLTVISSPDCEPTVTENLTTALAWKCRTSEGYLIPSLIPNLKRLELQIENEIAASFVSVLQARRPTENDESGLSGLEFARARITGLMEQHTIDHIEELRKGGLSVVVDRISPS